MNLPMTRYLNSSTSACRKSDFLSEWRKMYLETQQETSDNILNDDEDEDEEQEL